MAEKRPDLAALEVNDPFSYIGYNVFPAYRQPQKVESQYYILPTTDSSAQTGRTLGQAPTTATVATATQTATTAEVIDRILIPDDEIPRWGGTLDAAYKLAAIIAKRNVMRAIEDAQAAQALHASITGVDILGTGILYALDTAIDTIHQVPGRVCGACGWTTFRRLIRYSEITNLYLRNFTGGPNSTTDAVRLINADGLAQALGLAKLYVGDSDHWTAGKLLVFKEVNEAMPPWADIQIGRTYTYWPSEESPIEIEVFKDEQLKSYTLDCRAWYVVKRIATREGCCVIGGIDEGNADTTTTTTTTTTT